MKLQTFLARVVASAALTLAASAAHAALYNFSITGDFTASWQADSNPVPDDWGDGLGFTTWDVLGDFGGVPEVDLTFYNDGIGGGIEIYDFWGGTGTVLITDGPQLYTGTEESPTFKLGTFSLTEFEGTGNYTLTVTAVPEPASLALMLGGLGLVGAAAARRRQAESEKKAVQEA